MRLPAEDPNREAERWSAATHVVAAFLPSYTAGPERGRAFPSGLASGGAYEYKVAPDGSWDVNNGLHALQNGPNSPLALAAPQAHAAAEDRDSNGGFQGFAVYASHIQAAYQGTGKRSFESAIDPAPDG